MPHTTSRIEQYLILTIYTSSCHFCAECRRKISLRRRLVKSWLFCGERLLFGPPCTFISHTHTHTHTHTLFLCAVSRRCTAVNSAWADRYHARMTVVRLHFVGSLSKRHTNTVLNDLPHVCPTCKMLLAPLMLPDWRKIDSFHAPLLSSSVAFLCRLRRKQRQAS